MGFFSDDSDQAQASNNVGDDSNKATWTGEIIGGAAAYEGMKKYEEHCAANGQPSNHAEAKELLAGFTGVEADRLIQTKGMDAVDNFDADRARASAQEQASSAISPDNY